MIIFNAQKIFFPVHGVDLAQDGFLVNSMFTETSLSDLDSHRSVTSNNHKHFWTLNLQKTFIINHVVVNWPNPRDNSFSFYRSVFHPGRTGWSYSVDVASCEDGPWTNVIDHEEFLLTAGNSQKAHFEAVPARFVRLSIVDPQNERVLSLVKPTIQVIYDPQAPEISKKRHSCIGNTTFNSV